MCEILVKASDTSHPDRDIDRGGCYKRGYPIVAFPDGHKWGRKERPPWSVVVKLPGVPVEAVQKYLAMEMVDDEPYRRRLWKIRLDDLPLVASEKLAAVGELTIGATPETISNCDLTWDAAKTFFRNQQTGLDETTVLIQK